MSYYDDFGLPTNASPEHIREAYKLLARLLHPDQQTDPALKWAAEGQMRRINRAYAVLADPEGRRLYDIELQKPVERPAPLVIRTPNAVVVRTQLQTAPLLWIGAAVFSLGAIIWLATQGQLSQGQTRTMGTSMAEARPSQDIVPSATAAATASRRSSTPEPTTPAALPPPVQTQPAADPPAVQVQASSPATNLPTYAPAPSYTPPQLPAPLPSVPLARHFGGFWALPREKNFQHQSGQYLPQFIEATITEQDGVIRGKYRARYYVSDRPISPNVNFEFEGRAEGGLVKLPWHGEGGSAGMVDIKLLSAEEMELVWRATEFGQVLGLASGTAVLMRRPD